jgi:hypothetical protein
MWNQRNSNEFVYRISTTPSRSYGDRVSLTTSRQRYNHSPAQGHAPHLWYACNKSDLQGHGCRVSIEEPTRSRLLRGPIGGFANLILIILPLTGVFFLLNIPQRINWMVFPEQYVGLFLALALCGTFLVVPAGRSESYNRVPWYDLLASAAGLAVGLYIFIYYPKLVSSLGEIRLDKVILGSITVLLLLEASRRLVGWPLVIIAGFFSLLCLFCLSLPWGFLWQGPVRKPLVNLSLSRRQRYFWHSSKNCRRDRPGFHPFWGDAPRYGRGRVFERFRSCSYGSLPRRTRQNSYCLVKPFREYQRQRRGQCGSRRHVHDPDDEESASPGITAVMPPIRPSSTPRLKSPE